jgi:hypothetical protein
MVCDFCSDDQVIVEYPAENFICPNMPIAESIGSWNACAACAALIVKDDWTGLASRAVETFKAKCSGLISRWDDTTRDRLVLDMRQLHAKFREFRTGPGKPLRVGG